MPFDFLNCFLGNTGATGPQCLVYKMESIPVPLSCHTGMQLSASIHRGAAEGSSHQMPPRQRNTHTIIVWASHTWAEGEMKEFGVRLSTPVANSLFQQGFEDKANGKDKEEIRCFFFPVPTLDTLRDNGLHSKGSALCVCVSWSPSAPWLLR